jgi:hypothetical protein
MLTIGVDGAEPVAVESFSQLPPSAVLDVAVHFSAPAPAFRMERA